MKELEKNAYKRIPLEILNNFADFCESHGLHYSLAYGTLLGAIRHKGFIPWDDDVDVFMMRDEYERFRELYYSDRYPFVDMMIDKNHPVEMGKLYDSNTVIYTYGHVRRKYGLFVDVIPVDNVPTDEDERRKWLSKIHTWSKLNQLLHLSTKDLKASNISVCKKVLYSFVGILPITSFVHHRLERLFCKYRDVDTELVGMPMFIHNGNSIKTYPKRIFNSYTWIEFEKRQYMVMTGYEEFLRLAYGDYMQLPPEEQRVGHHDIIAYYKNHE